MRTVKEFKNIKLIQIHGDSYCVQRTYKNWLGKIKVDYYLTCRNGTNFTSTALSDCVTIDTLERCEYIFNANCIQMGAL